VILKSFINPMGIARKIAGCAPTSVSFVASHDVPADGFVITTCAQKFISVCSLAAWKIE
jgi:hypothetical protein